MNFFDFLNYRELLKETLENKKRENPYFSYRWLSKRAGISSTGFLSLVLNGKRNISPDLASRLCDALKFTKKESAYFTTLVRYNQSENPDEKKRLFEELLALRPSNARSIASDQQQYFNKWYYSAIREILAFHKFKDNYDELAATVQPQIKASEAKKAIDLLGKLQLIRKNEDGFYEVTSRFMTTGESWHSIAIRQYQEEMLVLAKDALEKIPRDERDFSTMTISLSQDGFNKVREGLKQFRHQIFEIVEKENHVDCAYQLNFQVFPVSKKREHQTELVQGND